MQIASSVWGKTRVWVRIDVGISPRIPRHPERKLYLARWYDLSLSPPLSMYTLRVIDAELVQERHKHEPPLLVDQRYHWLPTHILTYICCRRRYPTEGTLWKIWC